MARKRADILLVERGLFDSRARPERPKADLKETLRDEMAAAASAP